MTLLFGSFSYAVHVLPQGDGSKEVRFYPLSGKMLGQMRGIARPIIDAFLLFTAGGKTDYGQESTSMSSSEGHQQTKLTIQPISTEIAKLRSTQRSQAMEKVIETALSPATLEVLCLVIADSMRQEVERKDVESFAKKMAEDISIEMLQACLEGVAKANKKVLAPFLDKLKAMGAIFSAAAERLVEELQKEPAPAPSEGSPAESPETPSGSSSSPL